MYNIMFISLLHLCKYFCVPAIGPIQHTFMYQLGLFADVSERIYELVTMLLMKYLSRFVPHSLSVSVIGNF